MKRPLILVSTAAVLFVACVFSMGVGAVYIPAGTVLRVLAEHAWLTGALESSGTVNDTIVWEIRLPRTLLAVLVGAALASSGGVMQGFFQNPMADPYIMGISAGAALGATAAVTLNMEFWMFGLNAVSIAAFLCALTVTMVVYALSRRGGSVASTTSHRSGSSLACFR